MLHMNDDEIQSLLCRPKAAVRSLGTNVNCLDRAAWVSFL